MATSVTLTLSAEDLHDLLIALDVIEMLSEVGPNADVNAMLSNLVAIRGELADAIEDAGYVVLNDRIRRPTSDLLAAVAMYALNTCKRGRNGELVEK